MPLKSLLSTSYILSNNDLLHQRFSQFFIQQVLQWHTLHQQFVSHCRRGNVNVHCSFVQTNARIGKGTGYFFPYRNDPCLSEFRLKLIVADKLVQQYL